jgi:hypothetical protein
MEDTSLIQSSLFTPVSPTQVKIEIDEVLCPSLYLGAYTYLYLYSNMICSTGPFLSIYRTHLGLSRDLNT